MSATSNSFELGTGADSSLKHSMKLWHMFYLRQKDDLMNILKKVSDTGWHSFATSGEHAKQEVGPKVQATAAAA